MLIASTSISGLPRQLWPGEAEQAVLDFVPSAGPAREVADDDLQPDSICELLQLYLPQPAAGAVGPAEGPR
jgi:hypothetical protein